ncbi:MAG: hypothetical protein QOI12_2939 [Alphaproteobacteria bacterium]|nr:hypothetical protein [Alphaproteobacteria bacterium]
MAGQRAPRAFLALLGAVLFVPLLAASAHAQVTMTVDAAQNVKPISPYIYGVNLPGLTYGVVPLLGDVDASWNVTVSRLGGYRWETYNWQNSYSNSGTPLFQNDQFLSSDDMTQGAAVAPAINDALTHSAAVLLTIPLVGNSGKTYVAADSIPGNHVLCATNDFRPPGMCTPNPNYLTQRFTESNPGYQQQFVDWVKTNWPANLQAGAPFPIWFSLDNEPELWKFGHPELRVVGDSVTAPGYAELVSLATRYATAVKVVAPNTLIFGPVTGVWEGKTSLNGAPDGCDPQGTGIGTCYSSDIWFLDHYLSQMNQASTSAGKRLLDVLDTHYYTNALSGPLWTYDGISVGGQDTSPAVVAARVQAPRSLWDPTYIENSYLTDSNHLNGPIKLIPRLQAKIANGYPGTKIGLTEWSFGGGASISGGIATADALGIFGSHGVYAAMHYPINYYLPHSNPDDVGNPFVIAAFKIYRNFDGNGATFGDTSISATTADNASTSIYASLDSSNPGRMTLVLINKTGTAVPTVVNLSNAPAFSRADIYELNGSASAITYNGFQSVTNPAQLSENLPPYSIIVLHLSGVQAPTVASVSPASGPTAGGTSVTITGTKFIGATAVKFGTTAATSFTVNSSALITATAPAGSAGVVDVKVTSAGGTSAASAADQFTYRDPTLQVTPATAMISSGPPGGAFSPSSFVYTLTTTTGTVGFSISGVPSWFDASTTSGTATTSATNVTFTVNASANSLAAGTYGPATITFTNTTNGLGNTSRNATLTVNAAGALTRTFVSANGSDANTCSRAAPCRTLAGAIAKTNAGGEINMLNPAGYGAITITKAISIVNDGVGSAGVLVPSGQTGITVNAGADDKINLRGLIIEGTGVGQNGIVFNSGMSLTLENSVIRNLTSDGLQFTPNASSSLSISNVVISDTGGSGLVVAPSAGATTAAMRGLEAYNNVGSGVLLNGTSAVIRSSVMDSVASKNGVGFAVLSGAGTTSMLLRRSVASANTTGLIAQGAGATLRAAQNVVTGNATGLAATASGSILSYLDNYIDDNGAGQTPTGNMPKK